MLEALLGAFAVFAATFVALRLIEWGYHHVRKTPDWSPHWGSWLFAVLMGVYAFVMYVGRR
jgi:drug/metabolite transporter (DMT)-like permease